MTLSRDQLLALEKETLVEIILQQSARLAELEARLLSLEARLKQNSQNSSKPPSSDPPWQARAPKAKGKENKKSGGQPGHKGHGLSRCQTPARILEHSPQDCADCGCSLTGEPAEPAGVWQVFDLPADLSIEVTQHERFSVCCPWCGKDNQGRLPAHIAPETPCQWGPRCRALAVYLIQQQHLPYERTQALFVDLFGAAPSEGTLFNWLQAAYETLAPVEEAIAEALLTGAQVGADETPARGAGWLHCLVSEHFTWYGCHQRRAREAIAHFGLLPRFTGLLMSDALSTYTIYGGERSLCNAHLLGELEAIAEQGHSWAQQMRHLLLSLKERVEGSGAPLCRDALHGVYRWFGRVLALARRENAAHPVAKSASVVSRRGACREAYLRFASRAGAWFDNNLSERALRMMKLHVKISGCFRSPVGCRMLCRIRGYLSTMDKQGQNLFAALTSVMKGEPLLPPLLQHAN